MALSTRNSSQGWIILHGPPPPRTPQQRPWPGWRDQMSILQKAKLWQNDKLHRLLPTLSLLVEQIKAEFEWNCANYHTSMKFTSSPTNQNRPCKTWWRWRDRGKLGNVGNVRKTNHTILKRVGSCLTTQIYKELKKDQTQQLPGMKAVEAIFQERPKRKKNRVFSMWDSRRWARRSNDSGS